MRRSEKRILTSHTGKLFKPGSGYMGFGRGGPKTPEDVKQEVTDLVQAQLDIGMDVVSNGEPAGIGMAGLFGLLEGVTQELVEQNLQESILSTKRIRWLPREMLKFQDFYLSMFERLGMGGSHLGSTESTCDQACGNWPLEAQVDRATRARPGDLQGSARGEGNPKPSTA
jgi:hypothetical protein